MENPVFSSKITSVRITPRRSANGSEGRGFEPVQIENIVGEILYYETLLSPTTTATIIIANPNGKQKISDAYMIEGGEKIDFEIYDYTSKTNNDASYGLKQTMFVDQVTAYTSNQFVEVFKLNCTSTWLDTLDSVGQVTGTVTGTTSNIANQIYKASFNKDIKYRDQSTEQTTATFGATKKDETFPAIMALAAKSATKDNAGFFFYETKFGHHFKAVDTLIEEAKEERVQQTENFYEYTYTGVNPGIENPALSAKTILHLDQRFNNFTFKKAARYDQGIKASFDPIAGQAFYQPISGSQETELFYNFKGLDVKSVFENPEDFQKAIKSYNLKFSGSTDMIFRRPEDYCILSENPYKTKVPASARYTNFFGRMVTMVVPANTSLIAGSAVKLNIQKVKEGVNCSMEDEIVNADAAGLYIVAAVCHAFDQQKAYTSALLVRDLPFRTKN